MTDVPQPNTEAARPKGLDGVHWLPGPYTFNIPLPFPRRGMEGAGG